MRKRLMSKRSCGAVEGSSQPEPNPGTPAPEPSTATADVSRMCLACGQMLRGGEAKCPSCGAPIKGRASGRRTNRPRLAAFMFLITTLLVGFYGIVLLVAASSDLPQDLDGAAFAGSEFRLLGTVVDENNEAVPNATVRLARASDDNTTTADANGTFSLQNLTGGYHKVRFEAPNRTAVDVRLLLVRDENVRVQLVPGDGVTVQDHSTYTTLVRAFNVCGGLLVVVGLLQLAGAIACWRRKAYRVALSAGIVAVFLSVVLALLVLLGAFQFLPVVVISVLALVFVVKGKNEFA